MNGATIIDFAWIEDRWGGDAAGTFAVECSTCQPRPQRGTRIIVRVWRGCAAWRCACGAHGHCSREGDTAAVVYAPVGTTAARPQPVEVPPKGTPYLFAFGRRNELAGAAVETADGRWRATARGVDLGVFGSAEAAKRFLARVAGAKRGKAEAPKARGRR